MSNHTIPQSTVPLKFIEQAPAAKCRYCDAPAASNVTPPLCDKHIDLVMLISHLQKNEEAVTLDNAQLLLARCRRNGGQWTLTEIDLLTMFPEFLRCTGREVPA